MVGGGGAGFEQLQAASGIRRGGGEDGGERLQRNVVRAGAGDQRAARCEQAQRAQVQLFVAAQRGLGRTLGLGEGGRVEHDAIEEMGLSVPTHADDEAVVMDGAPEILA